MDTTTLLSKTENAIWDIPAINTTDDSIEKYDFVSIYDDNHGTGSLANTTQYSLTTNNEDIWYVPSQSYLIVNIRLRKADGTAYDWAADDVNISNNAFNIFEEARYYIDDKEVERIDYPGIATMVNNLRNYGDEDEINCMKHPQLWFLNDSASRKAHFTTNCEGDCNVLLPLNRIFPFCKNISHAFRGVKHRITFRLKDSNALIERGAAAAAGKIFIDKIEWKIPHVEPSLPMMSKLENLLAKDSVFKMEWPAINVYRIQPPKTKEIRTSLASTIHKPTNVFIMCQLLNRTTSQLHKDMRFDNFSTTECQVEVNSVRFPDKPIVNNFSSKSGVLELYHRFLESCKDHKSIDYPLFCAEYPIWHIDVSKHKSELYENTSFPNIVVNMKYSIVPASDYILWVVIFNEREAVLNLENKKMRVIK